MPAIELQSRHQRAVLWMYSGVDDYGEDTVDDPIEIDVRWDVQSTTETETVTAVVDRDITVGSRMWLGYLRDLPAPATEVYHVLDFKKTPDIKGRNYFRMVTLGTYLDEVPA